MSCFSDCNANSGVERNKGHLIPVEERFGILRIEGPAGWWSLTLAYEIST